MPGEIKKIGTLEIEAGAAQLEPAFLIMQRIGIILMSLLLLAGIFGYFGKGILGKTKVDNLALQIAYDKYARVQATNILHISIKPLKNMINTSPDIHLWIDQSFFRTISLKSINPTPASEEIINDKIVYTFKAYENQNTMQITMVIEPEEFGTLHAEIGLLAPQAGKVKINQFIYP